MSGPSALAAAGRQRKRSSPVRSRPRISARIPAVPSGVGSVRTSRASCSTLRSRLSSMAPGIRMGIAIALSLASTACRLAIANGPLARSPQLDSMRMGTAVRRLRWRTAGWHRWRSAGPAARSLASLWLMPRLRRFAQACPDVALNLSAAHTHSNFALGQADINIPYGVSQVGRPGCRTPVSGKHRRAGEPQLHQGPPPQAAGATG
jgi:hypothetical protein